MSKGFDAIMSILRTVSLQIDIWQWEMRMIARYGWNWGYKDKWDRL